MSIYLSIYLSKYGTVSPNGTKRQKTLKRATHAEAHTRLRPRTRPRRAGYAAYHTEYLLSSGTAAAAFSTEDSIQLALSPVPPPILTSLQLRMTSCHFRFLWSKVEVVWL